jgi:hypothetical protein
MKKPSVAKSMTRRGLPVTYASKDPLACNAPTLSGKPCRAQALESGQCPLHGGTGRYPRSRVVSEQKVRQQMAAIVARLEERNPGFEERAQLRKLKRVAAGKLGPAD